MKKKTKTIIILVLLSSLILAYLIYRYVLPSSLKPGDYKTTLADVGPVVMSVPATGVVIPAHEILLLSPYSCVVTAINKAPGSHVDKGEIILSLDTKSYLQEIENLKDQLGVMENDLQKNRLNARSIRVDLEYNDEVKNLKIASLKAELADQEQLLKVGGISPALYEQTRQELVLAEKDLKMTREKNAIRLKQLEADEKGLQLQIDIRNKELALRMEVLSRMTVRAPSDGIVLGVFANEGEKVDKDKLLVNMSNLSSYKINGTTDNKYIDLVKTGGEVYAMIDHARLKGKIGTVSPVIKDKKINFDVFLDSSQFNKLVPNLEVEMMIVTQHRDSVLRIERGPALNKGRIQDLYVIKADKAVRTSVTTGLIGTEYVEILTGLQQGDRVIISDASSFRHRKEIDFQDF
jgi:HlyD family secretion protein